jgi:hypothetical protein
MWPATVTPCVCPQPGWCARHKCQKSRSWHLLCRTQMEYFNQWEAGTGPCLNRAPDGTLVSFAPLPRCRHRGEDVLEEVRCELCQQREVQVPVYGCALMGKCTESRFMVAQKRLAGIIPCPHCPSYCPADAESVGSSVS